MVVAIVLSLVGLVKVGLSKTKVDSVVFRLHYRWTTSFCFLCCALLAASDLIGTPIECDGAPKAATTYCWVTSTYTINTTTKDVGFGHNFYEAYGSKFVGIGQYNPKLHEKTFHAYYQWVAFVLVLQGCLFYLPHTIWKFIEGKQLDNLLQGLTTFNIVDENDEIKKKNIIKYLRNSWGLNQKYCSGYFICELLNLFNVCGQMFLLNSFFGGMFLHYGTKILLLPTEDEKSRFDPMIETFPRVTKCDFRQYGSSGTIENRDYLCILPHNVLNEKIFLVIWIWFVLLAFITTGQIIFHVCVLHIRSLRIRILEQGGRLRHSSEIESLVRSMHLGDFFLIQAIGNNIDAFCFRSILKGLHEELNNVPITPKMYAENPSFENDHCSDSYLRYRKKMISNV